MTHAVVFDLDDTLIASMPGYLETMRRTTLALGWPMPTDREIMQPFSDWQESVERLFPDLPFSIFRARYRELIEEIPYRAIDGVLPILETLQQRYRLGIVTNRSEDLCALRMRQASISAHYFEFIHTLEDLPAAKPDPRALMPALEWFQRQLPAFHPGQVVYVGDRVHDAQAAVGAGMNFFAVLTGVESREEFLEAGIPEEKILGSVRELPQNLD